MLERRTLIPDMNSKTKYLAALLIKLKRTHQTTNQIIQRLQLILKRVDISTSQGDLFSKTKITFRWSKTVHNNES